MPFFGVPIRNGLPIGLGSVAGFGVQQFDPSQLFAGGTVAGAWYDPSDLSTMFTTSDGTTPVAMPGLGSAVSVGLMLDKSQGLVLGPELITPAANRDFSSNTGYWIIAGNITITGGQAVYTSANSLNGIYRTGFTTAGTYYEVTFTVGSITAGALRVYAGGNRTANVTTAGTYTQRVVAGSTDTLLIFECFGTTTLTLDDVSVKVVSGNHAIAFNNTTARPELRARVNLLTYSEQFDNAYWDKNLWPVTIAANTTATTDPLGGNTADKLEEQAINNRHGVFNAAALTGINGVSYTYSVYAKAAERSFLALDAYTNVNAVTWFDLSNGTVATNAAGSTATITAAGNGWYRCSVTRTATVGGANQFIGIYAAPSDNTLIYLGAAGSGIYIWGADLRPANIGANVPAYQRIADANTYDTSGFPLYLRFDGIDDSMYTPANLNLSGADKVSVFAGVRKLSSLVNFYSELTTDAFTLAGGFYISSSSNVYAFVNQGSFYEPSGYVPPISNVLACSYDLSKTTLATEIIPRIDGVVTQTGGSGSGSATGNFANAPLFIGARNNASFFLNGHLHSLIIAGSAVSAGNISATEQWVAGKTGIVIP